MLYIDVVRGSGAVTLSLIWRTNSNRHLAMGRAYITPCPNAKE